MDSVKTISIVALAVATAALAVCCYGVFVADSGGEFTESEVAGYLKQIDEKGGNIQAGGTYYSSSKYDFSISNHKLLANDTSRTSPADIYIPFSQIERIYISSD